MHLLAYLKEDWNRYTFSRKHFVGQKVGEGCGIVITAGGLKYFTTAYVLINTLRNLGCTLPIEVWYHGDELSNSMCKLLRKLNVKCCNTQRFFNREVHGFLMKPLAILYSNFKEVLYLDADNNCVRDPTYLFNDMNYKKFGCLFWPDYW